MLNVFQFAVQHLRSASGIARAAPTMTISKEGFYAKNVVCD